MSRLSARSRATARSAPSPNQSYGRIEGCVSRVNVTNAASYGGVTGGIAARVYASGAIVNCGNEGSVTCTLSSAYSDAKVGGIVGASYAPITGCYNTGAINGGSNNRGYVGGIGRLHRKRQRADPELL